MQEFDSLPSITITNASSNNCSVTGKYIIEATSDKDLDFTKKNNIIIPFSSPDSSGLCAIKVTNKINLTISCENREEFSPSEIIIPSQTIKDKDDVTPLFKIDSDYTFPTQFACAISDNSLKSPYSSSNNIQFSKSGSKGLGGGTIAVIVICCVAVVAIIGTLIALSQKGFFSKAPRVPNTSVYDNSSIERFSMSNKNANIV